MPCDHLKWLNLAVDLALENVKAGGRPFGSVLVRDGECIATGVNQMVALNDPSSRAEMEALRHAGMASGSVDMSGTVLYASGQPCPMCLAAAIMTKVGAIAYVYDNDEAEPFGFSSQRTYDALGVKIDATPMPVFKVSLPDRKPSELNGAA